MQCEEIWAKDIKAAIEKVGSDYLEGVIKWNHGTEPVTVDLEKCEKEIRSMLLKIHKGYNETRTVSGKEDKETKRIRRIIWKIETFERLHANPEGAAVTDLKGLVTAIKAYLQSTPNKWIFFQRADGTSVPAYVEEVEYLPPGRNRDHAATVLVCRYMMRGQMKGKNVYWNKSDIKDKKTAVQYLQENGMYRETPEAVAEYEKELARYHEIRELTGEQYMASGAAEAVDEYWYSRIPMVRDGVSTTVIMDDQTDEGESRNRSTSDGLCSTSFWGDDEGTTSLPPHPFVKVFDMEKDRFVTINTALLEPYEYDVSVGDKLILPEGHKLLVDLLVAGRHNLMDDIIRGKTGGIIILCTGKPGVGKTLTAEVYAQVIMRPLYKVQCSQLGTKEEHVEARLKVALSRAVRWKALLLIDEADVYVRARGEDIQQNAIVGVFLRTLEYYSGVMFLTSNRVQAIDDAILSRATAHLRYDTPNTTEAKKIWQVLADQFEVSLDKKTIRRLALHFKGASGRDIKSLLKLAKFLADRNEEEVDFDTLDFVSQYLDIGDGEGVDTSEEDDEE